ncbi:heterokaryon incompatibility protein-domain-containing protein [Fusarium oxysporum]|nr:heterokaryon incompatibility protein-domain-containing protein [Fusarium oxysporum]
MRLIKAKALQYEQRISFEEFYNDFPKYAILSHTWDETQEVTFQDCNYVSSTSKTGYSKIRRTCELALAGGIEYVWVDTCCIDKSSSAELTEAINSMFRWYQQAKVCYVHLADKTETSQLKNCRWFSRGWTLQELIAPKSMMFFDCSWTYIGSKGSLMNHISSITSIDVDILSHKAPISSACIAKRFSWAAGRKTTRVEDMAYCLLGLCDINMPMLYGEGQVAFRRLQEEIIKSTYDLSILAWRPPNETSEEFLGFLAESVHDFASCSEMYFDTNSLFDEGEMSISNKGLKIKTPEIFLESLEMGYRYALLLNCKHRGVSKSFLTVPMRKIGPYTFVRARSLRTQNVDHKTGKPLFDLDPAIPGERRHISTTLLTKLPNPAIQTALTPARSSRIISSNRYTVIQIEFPPEIPQSITQVTPGKCWDEEDCAFFGCHSFSQNWAAISLNGLALFVCFWGQKENRWSFRGTLLKGNSEGLDQFKDELFLFAEELNYRQPIIRSLLRDIQDEDESSVRIVAVKRADDPNLCSGPRWKVAFKREFLNYIT